MEVPPATGNPPVSNPQVSQPINSTVPTDQAPATQAKAPPNTNVAQSPPVSQPPSPVNAVISEPKKSSKFKLFLIISVVLIVLIWGTVAYLYFQS